MYIWDIWEGPTYDPMGDMMQVIGCPDNIFLPFSTINQLCQAILSARERKVDYRDIVVGVFYLADLSNKWALANMMQQAFEGESIPSTMELTIPGLEGILWTHQESAKKAHLYKTEAGAYRTAKNHSSAFMAPSVVLLATPSCPGPQ
jgi:hypothetical protein